MKKIAVLCLLCLTLGAGSVWASTGSTNPNDFQDAVEWCSQSGFSCPNSVQLTPQPWVSAAGNTGLVGNTNTQNFNVLQQSVTWAGDLPANMGVVYNGVKTIGTSPTTIGVEFDQPLFGAGAWIQPDFIGDFTASITLLDQNLNPIFTFSTASTSTDVEGTGLFIGAFDQTADVWGAIFDTTGGGDDHDFAIGTLRLQTSQQSTTPEPSTLLLVGPSLLGMAGVLRRRMASKEVR